MLASFRVASATAASATSTATAERLQWESILAGVKTVGWYENHGETNRPALVIVGGFLGAAYGKTDIRFLGDPGNAGNNPRVAGALGGAQIGYNYQLTPGSGWVLGVEADLQYAGFRRSDDLSAYYAYLDLQDGTVYPPPARVR